MESMALGDLNWKMNCVMPSVFVRFSRSRLSIQISQSKRMKTLFRDLRLMNNRPLPPISSAKEDNTLEVSNEEEQQENGSCEKDQVNAETVGREIGYLLVKEVENPRLDDKELKVFVEDTTLRFTRIRLRKFMIKIGRQCGLSDTTIYKGVSYLYACLAMDRTIELFEYEEISLLSESCLWLSASLEEKLKLLIGYNSVEAPIWYLYQLWTKEIYVRTVLKGNMDVVTPFPFAQYFVRKYNIQVSEKRLSKKLMRSLEDIRILNDHRPSVIAVAAILLAVKGNRMTREEFDIEINSLPLNEFVDIENVWYCCSVLGTIFSRLRH